jgi:hypothetical protein
MIKSERFLHRSSFLARPFLSAVPAVASLPFAAELARAVREVMSAKGYNVFICVSEHSAKEDIAAFDALADHRVDGIIVATRANKLGNDRLAEMIERGIPVVLIGRDFRHPAALNDPNLARLVSDRPAGLATSGGAKFAPRLAPGAVDKGERQVRGQRLALSTLKPVASARFVMRLWTAK